MRSSVVCRPASRPLPQTASAEVSRLTGLKSFTWQSCTTLPPLFFMRLKESDARAHVLVDAWNRLRLAHLAGADRNMHSWG